MLSKWIFILRKKIYKNYYLSKISAWMRYAYLELYKKEIKEIEDTLDAYLDAQKRSDKEYIKKIKIDMIFCRRYYRIVWSQYFLFNFEKLNRKGRSEFIGEDEKRELTNDLHIGNDAWKFFSDKYLAYEKFKNFYKREVVCIQNDTDYHKFCEFTHRYRRFMIKAIDKAAGEGIYIINQDNEPVDQEVLFSKIMKLVPCVLEEYIYQDNELAKFHPNSVNTIRFATFLKDDEIVKMFALFRMGCGGSHVDNAGAGGIVAAVDLDTGIIKTMGYREDNMTRYLNHPDSGEQILGAQIPRWKELIELVEELAEVVPEQKYVGWDLALTNNGWIMVEGNDRAMFTGTQMCNQRGLRPVINRTFLDK